MKGWLFNPVGITPEGIENGAGPGTPGKLNPRCNRDIQEQLTLHIESAPLYVQTLL